MITMEDFKTVARELVDAELERRDAGPGSNRLWAPFPDSPQSQAYGCPADELFYGGAAGGGKTDLAIGLACTAHRRSLILRRESTQLRGIIERSREILDAAGRLNENTGVWRLPGGRFIELAGCKDEGDKRKFQGRPHDLIVFDECTEFTLPQVQFIAGWLRTETTGQRCRVVLTGNPPTTSEGQWVIRRYAPWLDKRHPRPASPGELRWFAMIDGEEAERPDGADFKHEGRIVRPKSRTFIRALVSDNPAYMATGYDHQLASLPEPLRSQMLYGDFGLECKDDPWQIIPASWLDAAVERWTPEPPGPLSALGVDVARGGPDDTTIVRRHRHWFGVPESYPGVTTTDGPKVAALVLQALHPGASVNLDVIGVGAAVEDALRANRVAYAPVNFALGTDGTDKSGRLGFANLRAEAYWRLREDLDPDSGSGLALPPDQQLREDLLSARWSLTVRGVKVEDKADIRKRLGRSPDRGDALVYAHYGYWLKPLVSLSAPRLDPSGGRSIYSNLGRYR